MQIDSLTLKNFKGFADREFRFHPRFNLLIGDNATGKTSILDALAVAMGSWFLGIPGQDSRLIRAEDVRVVTVYERNKYEVREQFPVEIAASGQIGDQNITWKRTLNGSAGRTTRNGANTIKQIAEDHQQRVMAGTAVTLPVLSYYGSGRLWLEPKDMQRPASSAANDPLSPQELHSQDADSEDESLFARRLTGYRYSVDDRCSPRDLLRWMRYQRRIELDEETPSIPYRTVIKALKQCLRTEHLAFSLRHGTLIADLPGVGLASFSHMSDGYRSMVAMIGDLAYKCAVLNPDLEGRALTETPGIVLIDELDLYLHPKWQRQVIEDLRTIFPSIQFICTTHSPFLIQSLRSGEELLMLDGQPPAQLNNKSLEYIAWGVMQATGNDAEAAQSGRYLSMKQAATEYLQLLDAPGRPPADPARLEQLQALLRPYADNPAFQAFLEMNRVARLGR